ncbi:hypothetical protein Glove_217g102 [Diversispora epigaea]|uniref:Uncharacterized protein n=1 Tax=Diversispora epigaea TaxID=1348612 RepID=A0A397IQ51_9GLOM|nr:hypothetical protein Glove_217g102 [Diversispora epigaea]
MQLWKEAPKEVKDCYDKIKSQAHSIHNEFSTNYLKRPASQLDNYSYIDNDLTTFSFSSEEFNESIESINNISFDPKPCFNLIENNENNGYEFFPFH